MIKSISDFELSQCLTTDGVISIYRARFLLTNDPCIIKIPAYDTIPEPAFTFLKREYALCSAHEPENSLQLNRLVKINNSCLLECKDLDVLPLGLSEQVTATSFATFFPTALSIVRIVAQLHKNGMIHANLSPYSLLRRISTGEFFLTGFYVATGGLPTGIEQSPHLYYPPSVAYISPEQTGNIDQTIDERSDLYSLGCVLYEMLTGAPPFTDANATSMLYSHVARDPVPVHEQVDDIPRFLSDIISKLLAKNPADRYQSVQGVHADLQECKTHYESGGNRTQLFTLGLRDRRTRLIQPKSLYGRDAELKLLSDKLQSARKKISSALFISGPSGIGKSALLDYFIASLDPARYLIGRGTCEEVSSTIPFHGLKSALCDLIRTIVSQGNEEISVWKERLTSALPYHRDLIVDFIPELQMILGPSSARRSISSDLMLGTQFKTAFTQLLRSFLSEDKVFILIIDDLQWADSALPTLLGPAFFDIPAGKFLFIGAGRTPLPEPNPFRDSFRKAGAMFAETELDVLSRKDSRSLIADALGDKHADLDELVSLIYEKTNGNPLFLKTFLEMLIERQLLRHITPSDSVSTAPHWTWDPDKIVLQEYTENVIDIIIGRIEKLPSETVDTLTIASVIGIRFMPEIIAFINDITVEETCAILEPSVEAGIVQCTTVFVSSTNEWHFCHDRIREALDRRLSPDDQTALHLKIGRKLLALQQSGESPIPASDIVRHFNPYMEKGVEPEEFQTVIDLNKQAGFQARNAYAYEIAHFHFSTILALLGHNEDKSASFSLRFTIELALAECDYLLSRFTEAEKRLTALKKNDLDATQLAALDWVLISTYEHRQKLDVAMDIAIKRLHAMGIVIPRKPSIPFLVISLVKTAFSVRALKKLPLETEPSIMPKELKLSFKFLTRLWVYAFSLQKQGVITAIAAHLIQCTKKYGVCGPSSVALCFWGILLGMITRNPKTGLKYGNMAMDIANRYDDRFSRGITSFLYGSFFAHLEGHLNNVIQVLSDGRRFSYESGDVTTTSNCTEGLLLFQALSGKELGTLQLQIQEAIRFNELIGVPSEDGLAIPQSIYKWTRSLTISDTIDIGRELAYADRFLPMERGILLLLHLFNAVIMNDAGTAVRFARSLKHNPLLDPTSYFYYFYSAMYALAVSRLGGGASSFFKKRFLLQKRSILKKGVALSSVNILPLYHLVNAEYLRLSGKQWEAMLSYIKAIDVAREQEYPHFAALASEYYSDFLNDSQHRESRMQLRNALQYYYDWGAEVKVAQLRKITPDIPFTPRIQSMPSGFAEIDIQALLKSLEAISNELLLNRLLEKLIRIVMENIGAQRGVLLLEQNGSFIVRVEGNLSHSAGKVTPQIEAQALNTPCDHHTLPHGIITYVAKSREPVRLEFASLRGRFVHDQYIRNNAVKSVLCIPLMNNERIRGMIYLENNTMEAAFPPSRLLLLKLLGSQAIISIDNALFHDIEIKHLQSKVNPHFIFNALSSLAELCHVDPDTTEDAIVKLSTLYRYVLTSEMHLVTLEEELEIVNKYLAIEKLRFGDRLTYSIQTDGDPTQVRMPSMLIQPLVENSIKHGISPRPEGGAISVLAKVEDTVCTIVVEDNGAGTLKNTSGTGYGLDSIRKRLALQFKDKATFEINDAAGYKVTFSFPVNPTGHHSETSETDVAAHDHQRSIS